MPIIRYFIFVGCALLSLIFAADAYFPQNEMTRRVDIDRSTIRIKSTQRDQGPIIYDLQAPILAAEAVPVMQDAAPSAPDILAAAEPATPRDAMAQMPTARIDVPVVERPTRQHRKFAKLTKPAPLRQASVALPERSSNAFWAFSPRSF